MPLDPFQRRIARLLAGNRTQQNHLAGGAALNITRHTPRFSGDLDYFHDSDSLVGAAFTKDAASLKAAGLSMSISARFPTFIRAVISSGNQSTKIEWAHDSAWRFLPAVKDPVAGYRLHPIDLAVNKVITLASRKEPRDYVDVLFINRNFLELGALCWAAQSKDPGLPPPLLLELISRSTAGYGPDAIGEMRTAFDALKLAKGPLNLAALRSEWMDSLEKARELCAWLPQKLAGCLFLDPKTRRFATPKNSSHLATLKPHWARIGGILPSIGDPGLLSGMREAKRAFARKYS